MKSFAIVIFSIFTFVGILAAQEVEKKIELTNIYKTYDLYPEGVHGIRSMNDGEHYTRLEKDTIFRYKYKTGERVDIIATASEMIPEGAEKAINLRSYKFSDDEQKILIPTESEQIYRHSSRSNYYIWDIKTDKLSALSENGKQRLANFSPDGTKVAFVRENNLFIKNLISNIEQQITTDGKFNEIINGTTDWVYEEEFGFTKAFYWSPEGNYIAYYRFDESDVKEFQFTNYGELYPEEYTYKYPKAGEDNSVVDLYIYSLDNRKIKKIDLGGVTDQYIPRIKWTADNNLLAIYRLNRHQNKLEIILNNVATGKQRVLYKEDNKYYIDINDDLTFLPDGSGFLFSSEKSGFNHLYYYGMDGKEISQLTTGDWDIASVNGYSPERKGVFFTAAKSSAINREVLFVSLKGKIKDIAVKTGTNGARFSKTFKYFIHTWSDANTPPVYSLCKGDGKEIRVIQNNEKLRELAKEYNFGEFEFFNFNTAAGINLNGTMVKPPNFDPNKEYPVLMWVYGGPGSQQVANSWGGGRLWYRMLAQDGIIVACVDNRGTGFRGEEFKKMTYQQLGKYETEDQIGAAEYLGALPYVDAKHIAIFGWSYGGYMSTLCLTKGADVFSSAIAVAPVTNWRYYDNIYTERYMRTPQENPNGYDDNSPINHVEKMKGDYLLIHGTADDNVHVQNSIDLATALVNANVDFEMMLYPNSNHGIYTGRNTRYHLYTKMTNFLLENLLP